MTVFYILLAIAIVLSAVFISVNSPNRPILSITLKGLASISILLMGVYAAFHTGIIGTTAGFLLLVGLGFCVLGDVVLALMDFNLPEKKYNIINCGEMSFFLAQIAFIVAMAFLMDGNALGISISCLFGIIMVGVIYLMQKPLKLDYSKSTAMTLIYTFGLSTSLAMSLANAIIAGFNTMSIILFVGLILFFLSDLILSNIYFKENSKHSLYYPNLILYYSAIILIATSLICG